MENISEYPVIRLGGKDYPVKPLVVKQLRIVVPALMRLRGATLARITEAQFDDLVEVVYLAICTSTPGLTRDAFTDFTVSAIELIQTVPVIAAQAGMTEGEATPGEAPAGQ